MSDFVKRTEGKTAIDRLTLLRESGQMSKRSDELTAQLRHMDSGDTTVGERIAFLRAWTQRSQAELARALSVSRGAVGQWEAGTTEPAVANLRRMANLFDIDFDWLATGRGTTRIHSVDDTVLRFELTVTLPEGTTFVRAADLLKDLKTMAEKIGKVSGYVRAGKQKFSM